MDRPADVLVHLHSLAVLMADASRDDDCESSPVRTADDREFATGSWRSPSRWRRITYLDRVCIAQTAQSMIRADLGLTKEQMGFVFSAFTIAYALFEIPTGAWGDRIGTRRVLTRIVDLVVELHDRDGRGVQLRVAAGDPIPLRHGRGGGVSRTCRRPSRDGSP